MPVIKEHPSLLLRKEDRSLHRLRQRNDKSLVTFTSEILQRTCWEISDQTQPYRSSILVVYYTLQGISAVKISPHQVRAGYT